MFWLETDKELDSELAGKLEALKKARKFAATVRDGLRLILDLRDGRTELLFSMFPMLHEKLQPIAAPPPGGGGEAFDELKTMLQIALANQSKDGYTMRSTTDIVAPQLAVTSVAVDTEQLFDDFMSFIQ